MWCLSAHNVRLSMSEQKKSARRLISSSFLIFRNQNHFTRNRIRQPSNLSHSIFLMLYSSPAHLTSSLFRNFYCTIDTHISRKTFSETTCIPRSMACCTFFGPALYPVTTISTVGETDFRTCQPI